MIYHHVNLMPRHCLHDILSLLQQVDDFEQVVENAASSRQKELPMFLGGHSMGGLVAAHVALDSRRRWSGLILHSPALDVEWNTMLRFQAKIGGVMSTLFPKARIVPAVRPEDMSQDPLVVQDYLQVGALLPEIVWWSSRTDIKGLWLGVE
jgi:alpha-beta hydrolase superfamily lysophospholipase